jgi:hypothetical protein
MFEQYKDPDASLLIRTDFSDDAAWNALCEAVQKPDPKDGFCAYFAAVDDPEIGAQSPATTAAQVHVELGHSAVFFADAAALGDPAFPVLCVEGITPSALSFRVIADHIWGPENNLRISNMDFEEFLAAAEPDGVFRGFLA